MAGKEAVGDLFPLCDEVEVSDRAAVLSWRRRDRKLQVMELFTLDRSGPVVSW